MSAKFDPSTCTVAWTGVSATTPPGFSTAFGKNHAGLWYLWLFYGDQADELFAGSVSFPSKVGKVPTAYNQIGVPVGRAPDIKVALAVLADLFCQEAAKAAAFFGFSINEIFRTLGSPPAAE